MNGRDELLTATQLAEWLQVPVSTIYRWRYQRTGPPGMRVGKLLRFRVRDVEAWLEQQRDHQAAAL